MLFKIKDLVASQNSERTGRKQLYTSDYLEWGSVPKHVFHIPFGYMMHSGSNLIVLLWNKTQNIAPAQERLVSKA